MDDPFSLLRLNRPEEAAGGSHYYRRRCWAGVEIACLVLIAEGSCSSRVDPSIQAMDRRKVNKHFTEVNKQFTEVNKHFTQVNKYLIEINTYQRDLKKHFTEVKHFTEINKDFRNRHFGDINKH